jgi:hypothetical protein
MKYVTVADTTEITDANLRALLFWASIGVCESYAGSYDKHIVDIITQYAKALKMHMRPVAFKSKKGTRRAGKEV